MASAWAQVAELERVNQRLRQTQLGALVSTSMHVRHLARMEPDVALQVLAPMQARITRMTVGATPVTGLAARLADTGLAPAAFATASDTPTAGCSPARTRGFSSAPRRAASACASRARPSAASVRTVWSSRTFTSPTSPD